MTTTNIQALETRLNDFDPAIRRDSLAALDALAGGHFSEEQNAVNMHCHSFLSYNALGYSPSRIAWEARKQGIYAVALCDFDVLDGLDEFLSAARVLSLRGAVHIETRAYFREFADVEINSPGEPGVTYIMGCGFYTYPTPGTIAANRLADFRQAARHRNEVLVRRINDHLAPVRVSYDREVLPLTPNGVATERHIITAYIRKAAKIYPDDHQQQTFWAGVLKKTPAQVETLGADRPRFEDAVRSALVKQGGVGYERPTENSFPAVDTFIQWVRSCDAVPAITWLDGTSDGERRCREMIECLLEKGCAALNIIPDRNWNIADPETRAIKVDRLDEIIREARRLDLPINIGTEMNKSGQPFYDDLNGPVLKRYASDGMDGARVMIGHSLLGRYAGMPYLGKKADALFPKRRDRNTFYSAVGALPPMTQDLANRLLDLGPDKALHEIRERLAASSQ